ncbi:fimbria/pilus chaperone family protein [Burkholderia alba]|uniref:fimbria/pilus chaperone family protein n=1 Tax=Burkholderia alba TaxID=2683677 RepID=UPI002B061A6B|nr:fimbria/pilus chaperone family protein [Burkholderia alba]
MKTLPFSHRAAPFAVSLAAVLFNPGLAHSMGMVPDTTIVIVDEADGEGSVAIRNTDNAPALLYTHLHPIPEDPADRLVVTPPMARVEPGARQLVRFVLDVDAPLKTQHLSRVTFEGIPPKRAGRNEIRTVVQQDLPVLIQPRDLPRNNAPWTLLKWSVHDGELTVNNGSRYVVRLEQSVQLLPGQHVVALPKPYVLPGETLRITLDAPVPARQVRIFPATVYGYSVEHHDAPLDDVTPR